VKLNLSANKINNHVIASFAGALAVNSTLRELTLHSISDVTTVGWQTLPTVLQTPTSVLKILDPSGDAMNDEVLSVYAEGLSNNKN
jgi:hypothetical protein